MEIADNKSQNEKPWHVKCCANQEDVQGSTRPNATRGNLYWDREYCEGYEAQNLGFQNGILGGQLFKETKQGKADTASNDHPGEESPDKHGLKVGQ